MEEYKRDHPDADEKFIKVDIPVAPIHHNPHYPVGPIPNVNAILQQALNRANGEVERLGAQEQIHLRRIEEHDRKLRLLDMTPLWTSKLDEQAVALNQARSTERETWYQVRLEYQRALQLQRQAMDNLAALDRPRYPARLPALVQPPVVAPPPRRAPPRNKKRHRR